MGLHSLVLSKLRYSKLALLSALLMLATACSTVTSYKKPVTDFATASSNAEAALLALDRTVTEDYGALLRGEVAAGKRLVRYEKTDCELNSSRCRLVATTPDGDSDFLPPEPLLGNMVTLMRGITAYTRGLNDIVTADTAAQVAASVNSTLGSIENLAKTINSLEGSSISASVSAYRTPAGKALNWMLGQYIAKLQIDGLRQATSSAQPVISRAATIFEAAAENAEVLPLQRLVKQFDAAWEKYEATPNEANLRAAIAKASAYDSVLRSRPSSVFSALGPAHAALTRSLRDDGGSVIEVIAKIEAFAAQAQSVVAIVRELADAGNN